MEEGGADVVVDGVYRWVEYPGRGRGGSYLREEPFPADRMVQYILRGARWTDVAGWELQYAAGSQPRRGVRSPRPSSVRGLVAEYCDRQRQLPEFAQRWSDHQWMQYAILADDKRRRGEALSALDRVALAYHPAPELEDGSQTDSSSLVYDRLRDTMPCILCGEIVIISVADGYPLHHMCAWRIARGEGK